MVLKRWLVIIFAALVLFSALAFYKIHQIQQAIAMAEAFPEPSETVESIQVSQIQTQPALTTIGEVVSVRTVELRNELEGRIERVNFASGARVQKGQVLLQLDVAEEQARLKAAKAHAEFARRDYDRIDRLRSADTVSEERLDQARTDFNVTNAEITRLSAVIDKKTLRAPFDAISGIHSLDRGEFLQEHTLITTLVGIDDHVWVDFKMPQRYANVGLGTWVEVDIPGDAGEPLSGQIVARDSTLSASSRNRKIRAKLPIHSALQPNTVVDVRVPLGEPLTAASVPASSVRRDGLGEYVYVLVPDADAGGYRAQRRNVVVGDESEHRIVVLQGLELGELIAGNGAFKLREGLLVFTKEPVVEPGLAKPVSVQPETTQLETAEKPQ